MIPVTWMLEVAFSCDLTPTFAEEESVAEDAWHVQKSVFDDWMNPAVCQRSCKALCEAC